MSYSYQNHEHYHQEKDRMDSELYEEAQTLLDDINVEYEYVKSDMQRMETDPLFAPSRLEKGDILNRYNTLTRIQKDTQNTMDLFINGNTGYNPMARMIINNRKELNRCIYIRTYPIIKVRKDSDLYKEAKDFEKELRDSTVDYSHMMALVKNDILSKMPMTLENMSDILVLEMEYNRYSSSYDAIIATRRNMRTITTKYLTNVDYTDDEYTLEIAKHKKIYPQIVEFSLRKDEGLHELPPIIDPKPDPGGDNGDNNTPPTGDMGSQDPTEETNIPGDNTTSPDTGEGNVGETNTGNVPETDPTNTDPVETQSEVSMVPLYPSDSTSTD